jgi:hypothetical protein
MVVVASATPVALQHYTQPSSSWEAFSLCRFKDVYGAVCRFIGRLDSLKVETRVAGVLSGAYDPGPGVPTGSWGTGGLDRLWYWHLYCSLF